MILHKALTSKEEDQITTKFLMRANIVNQKLSINLKWLMTLKKHKKLEAKDNI